MDGDSGLLRTKASRLAERLAASTRLQQRRFALLPLIGPGAVFTDVQGRTPGDATSAMGLAELVSSIAQVGVLQPILVEELENGGMLLVAGERRVRACRLGAVDQPENPHFGEIPAIVCPGPLSEEERRTWQLIENLAREDLQPAELAAALVFERCAVLSGRLADAGKPAPEVVATEPDPLVRWDALNRFRKEKGLTQVGAPWPEVLRGLGLHISEDKVTQLVRAFAQLPPEVAEQMDAERITVNARLTFLRLQKTKEDAAAELWEAVRSTGKGRLLYAAVRERLAHPDLDATEAITRADELDAASNVSRSEKLKHHPDDADSTSVDQHVLTTAVDALVALVAALRAGGTVGRYDAGSLVLYLGELQKLLSERRGGDAE